MIRRITIFLLASMLILLGACGLKNENANNSSAVSEPAKDSSQTSAEVSQRGEHSGELKVHFLDVAQGDSIFIELPDGKCMLIDAGEREYAGRVISLIDCLGYTKIDYLIATHPHSDHIGGMQRVVENFEIGEIYMPEAISDTKTFISLLETIESKGLSINVAKSGVNIPLGNGAAAKFVAPVSIVDDLNNCSAVLHLGFGNRSFLFMGDAEIPEEDTITDNIDCDVLKVGHHGSKTSSGEAFLKKATPEIAVISCGEGNEYGHPHDVALMRLKYAGIKEFYRTDLSGTVTVATDGEKLTVSEGLTPSGYKWVLNISTKKLHTATCKSAIDMKEENKAYSKRGLDELQALGYTLCGSCDPEE